MVSSIIRAYRARLGRGTSGGGGGRACVDTRCTARAHAAPLACCGRQWCVAACIERTARRTRGGARVVGDDHARTRCPGRRKRPSGTPFPVRSGRKAGASGNVGADLSRSPLALAPRVKPPHAAREGTIPHLGFQLHGRRNAHPACSRAERREIIMPLLHGKLSKTPPERFLICLAKRSRAPTMLQVVLRVP